MQPHLYGHLSMELRQTGEWTTEGLAPVTPDLMTPGGLRASLAGASQPADWQAMKTLGLELADRLAAHAQMEDGALLPALEDVLDEQTDQELLLAYAAQ